MEIASKGRGEGGLDVTSSPGRGWKFTQFECVEGEGELNLVGLRRMEIPVVVLLSFVARNVFANDPEDKVDYTKFVRWERRTLICRNRNVSNFTHLPADCRLKIGTDEREVSTKCFEEKFKQSSRDGRASFEPTTKRTLCDIKCAGADRDSVISKIPNAQYACVRWYNYNTLKRDEQWFMWRSGECRNLDITLEVHCGFPRGEEKSKSLRRNFQFSTNLTL
ncbi:hypothetical protein Tcan_13376 [Toxocara canis]|uniref:DUF7808 domain-containing protein n=1 Tax=Toxocara canis TaxID=6265 RepID=A0A0B2V2Q0_TOXCA|nr:hypothetical protein Tcan_13376 [Toxocara canis]